MSSTATMMQAEKPANLEKHFAPVKWPPRATKHGSGVNSYDGQFCALQYLRQESYEHNKHLLRGPTLVQHMEQNPNPRLTAFTGGAYHFPEWEQSEVLGQMAKDRLTHTPAYWNQIAYENEGGMRLVVDVDAHDRVLNEVDIAALKAALVATLANSYNDFSSEPIPCFVSVNGPRLKKGKFSTGVHIVAHVLVSVIQAKQLLAGLRQELARQSPPFDMAGLDIDDGVYRSTSKSCSLRMIYSKKKETCPACDRSQHCRICEGSGWCASAQAYTPWRDPAPGEHEQVIGGPSPEGQALSGEFNTFRNHSIWADRDYDTRHDYTAPAEAVAIAIVSQPNWHRNQQKEKSRIGIGGNTRLQLPLDHPWVDAFARWLSASHKVYSNVKIRITKAEVDAKGNRAYLRTDSRRCAIKGSDHNSNSIYFLLYNNDFHGNLVQRCFSTRCKPLAPPRRLRAPAWVLAAVFNHNANAAPVKGVISLAAESSLVTHEPPVTVQANVYPAPTPPCFARSTSVFTCTSEPCVEPLPASIREACEAVNINTHLDEVEKVAKFIRDGLTRAQQKHERRPLLLLVGPHGCGKSYIVSEACRLAAATSAVVETWMDEDRLINLRSAVVKVCEGWPGSGTTRKVAVLDAVDEIDRSQREAYRRTLVMLLAERTDSKFLRAVRLSTNPVIVTCSGEAADLYASFTRGLHVVKVNVRPLQHSRMVALVSAALQRFRSPLLPTHAQLQNIKRLCTAYSPNIGCVLVNVGFECITVMRSVNAEHSDQEADVPPDYGMSLVRSGKQVLTSLTRPEVKMAQYVRAWNLGGEADVTRCVYNSYPDYLEAAALEDMTSIADAFAALDEAPYCGDDRDLANWALQATTKLTLERSVISTLTSEAKATLNACGRRGVVSTTTRQLLAEGGIDNRLRENIQYASVMASHGPDSLYSYCKDVVFHRTEMPRRHPESPDCKGNRKRQRLDRDRNEIMLAEIQAKVAHAYNLAPRPH